MCPPGSAILPAFRIYVEETLPPHPFLYEIAVENKSEK